MLAKEKCFEKLLFDPQAPRNGSIVPDSMFNVAVQLYKEKKSLLA